MPQKTLAMALHMHGAVTALHAQTVAVKQSAEVDFGAFGGGDPLIVSSS